MTSGTAAVQAAQLYYEIEGEGAGVALLHTGFTDRRMWDAQWPALTQRFRTLRCDLRGFGRSDPIQGPFETVADLERLLAHTGLERAALVGCSYGGEIALDFALAHPTQVSALVLVSTAPGGFELQGEPPPDLFEMIAAIQQGDVEHAAELQMRIWIDGPFRQAGEADAAVRRAALEMTRIPIERQTFLQLAGAPHQPPAAQRLGEITAPALIVTGERDHPEILRAAAVMAAALPHARQLSLPNSAHLPNMEQPEAFNRAVVQFLAEVV